MNAIVRWLWAAAAAWIVSCAPGEVTIRPAENGDGWRPADGWSCAPDPHVIRMGQSPAYDCREDDPHEFLYYSFQVSPGSRAKTPEERERSCRDNAALQLGGDLRKEILQRYWEAHRGYICECQSAGIMFVREHERKIKEGVIAFGIYECCSLSQAGTCETRNPSWEDCLCSAYMKYPGGWEAFRREMGRLEEGEPRSPP